MLCYVLSMCMCAMALRLVLVFRPVSPLSGHSLAAGRRGGPTLSTGLDPVRHTSLELYIQNYPPYPGISISYYVGSSGNGGSKGKGAYGG